MPLTIEITDSDISEAERVILDEGCSFNKERRDFIRNLNTIDLQAVPGSGKTTALLAKLFILEKKLPFSDGSGILMLSHTNAAIDELKQKMGSLCPRLFEYPNFIGTIQTFVDQFLAIPWYVNCYGFRPEQIDEGVFEAQSKRYFATLDYLSKGWIYNQVKSYPENLRAKHATSFFVDLRFDKDLNLTKGLNGPIALRAENNTNTYQDLAQAKGAVLKKGYLHYDDAYFLANRYMHKYPLIKEFLRKRFSFIFVDEMQDMDTHQIQLLENIFYYKEGGNVYQRIGDKNQGIHTDISVSDGWNDREDGSLKIRGSHRLSPVIANVVKGFGLEAIDIEGLNMKNGNLKPHIIFFDNAVDVLEKFTELIKKKNLTDVETKDRYPFRAIGWREQVEESDGLGIQDYWPEFQKVVEKSSLRLVTLRDYLSLDTAVITSLEPVQDRLISALIRCLTILGKTNERGVLHNKSSFFFMLEELDDSLLQDLKQKLYNWCYQIMKGQDPYVEVKEYLSTLLVQVYPEEVNLNEKLGQFFEDIRNNDGDTTDTALFRTNIHNSNGIDVKIGTTHSVKGETHVATLYMECFYQRDIAEMGNYESTRLIDLFEGKKTLQEIISEKSIEKKSKAKKGKKANVKKPPMIVELINQSAKMVYVGFSRPTHLLCFAVHNSRRFDVDKELWEIYEI